MSQAGQGEFDDGEHTNPAMRWASGLIVLYLLPFLVVLLDERFFGTYWLSKHLPQGAKEVFQTLYPFIRYWCP